MQHYETSPNEMKLFFKDHKKHLLHIKYKDTCCERTYQTGLGLHADWLLRSLLGQELLEIIPVKLCDHTREGTYIKFSKNGFQFNYEKECSECKNKLVSIN